MTKINGPGPQATHAGQAQGTNESAKSPGKFSRAMSRTADGVLSAVSTIAPGLPGGKLIGMAADGLRGQRAQTPPGLSGGQAGEAGDQMDKMWAMQKENQVFNLQYMQLQNEVQADNRRFSTMSNLMKVRHDTAKAAINNMHA